MWARVALCALMLWGLPACAGPGTWGPQLTGWHSVELGAVRLLGDASPEETLRLARELVHFDAVFAELAGRSSQAEEGAPVAIYLLRDRELAARFGLGRGVAGWAFTSLEGSFASVEVRPNHVSTRRTLLHEYTHVLLSRNRLAPLPPWYNEGLATYFSSLYTREGSVVVGAPPVFLLATVAGGGLVPLEELLVGSIRQTRLRDTQAFYATAWALSHYLLSSPRGRDELSELARQLERGAPLDDARQAAFGRSWQELEQELAAHVAPLAQRAPGEVLIEARELAIREVPQPAALASGDAAYALGHLALQLLGPESGRRDFRFVRQLLETALREEPGNPWAAAALAEVRAAQGDRDGARELVEGALAAAPDDLRVRLHAGRVELAGAEIEPGALAAAEEHYRRALVLDPASAPSWFGLGEALAKAGRTGEAIVALESARRLGWSERLDLALGTLHLAESRPSEARALLWPLMRDPHGGWVAREARNLLEKAGLLHPEAPGG